MADGGFVMLGKTFKGLTDELLAWQTELFLRLETHRDSYTVYVAPEAVVEIAFDGVQTSPRYPGGVALRFARVLRYRPDKRASDADDLDAVLAIHGGNPGRAPPRRKPSGSAFSIHSAIAGTLVLCAFSLSTTTPGFGSRFADR